jgi:[NiFe] hydrogenase diaphorase moiety large subunit
MKSSGETTIREILDMCQADDPYFIQLSGPSGECISMDELDRRIMKSDLPCGGSFMIFNRHRDILNIMMNFTEFFKSESCGVCTPCRAGNFIIQRKLEKIAKGLAHTSDFEDIREWGNIMKITSRCGLGKAATRSLIMALDKFPDYFNSKIDHQSDGLNKEFDLERAVAEYDRFTN